MKSILMKRFVTALSVGLVVLSTMGIGTATLASGGGGGGGTVKVTEYRMTGYITEIDRTNSTVTIGNSYYNIGILTVGAATSISLDNVNCDLDAIQVGKWVEARYTYTAGGKSATKLVCTTL